MAIIYLYFLFVFSLASSYVHTHSQTHTEWLQMISKYTLLWRKGIQKCALEYKYFQSSESEAGEEAFCLVHWPA